MESLLLCLAENAEAACILLIAPPPLQFGDWVQTQKLLNESKRLSGLYRRLADKLGVAFADAGEWGIALTFDGVHFSLDGHAAFAAELCKALT